MAYSEFEAAIQDAMRRQQRADKARARREVFFIFVEVVVVGVVVLAALKSAGWL